MEDAGRRLGTGAAAGLIAPGGGRRLLPTADSDGRFEGRRRIPSPNGPTPVRPTVSTYGLAISTVASGVLIFVGFARWRRSRLAAYRRFERALLVAIFVTQFFAFHETQTTQVFELVVALLTYAAVRGMIAEEVAREEPSGA